ncbi:MAG: NAD(P)/FAD-dependent oxidoreductase [Cyanobacteria bacterium P01_G01_bin.67]
MNLVKLARRTFLAGLGTVLALLFGTKRGVGIMLGNDLEAKKLPEDQKLFDVIVIGGSFAGLSAALQIARTRRQVLVIDGGKPRNRFASRTYGFLGQDGKEITQTIQTARKQLLAYPTAHFIEGKAIGAERHDDDLFSIALNSKKTFQSKRIILATGVSDRLPEIPGLAERWGKTVNQCPYCHGYELAGETWGVLYTGEASLHQAKLMPDWSDKVILFANGSDKIQADERANLISHKITIEDTPIESIEGEDVSICNIRLQNQKVVSLKALFLITRSAIDNPIVTQLGCELEDATFGKMIKTNNLKETTVKGVFAAGDVARPIHNATWAASDGVSAGIFTHQSLVVGINPYQD